MGKVIKFDPKQQWLRKKQEEDLLEELERRRQKDLENAVKELPSASKVLWGATKEEAIEISKYLKSLPESERTAYLEKLRRFAEEKLSRSVEEFTDYVLNQTKPQGLDEDKDERKRIARVVEADIKRNIGGFAKVYKESFEELKTELEKSLNFQIPNEVLPIAIALAIARAIGSAVEILVSSGNFATGLSALGLDKYYQAKLSKAISIAEEKTGLRMDEETKEQLFELVGNGTSDRKLINAVASKMGTEFGLVFAKAWDELKPKDLLLGFDKNRKAIETQKSITQEQKKAQAEEQPQSKQEEGQKAEAKQEKAQAEKQEEEQKAELKQEEGQKAEAKKEAQKQAEQRHQEEEVQKNQVVMPPPEEAPGNQFMPSAPSPFPKMF